MAEDTSRRTTLGPVGVALLHKSPSQHFMAPTHTKRVWQPLLTTAKPAKRGKPGHEIHDGYECGTCGLRPGTTGEKEPLDMAIGPADQTIQIQ